MRQGQHQAAWLIGRSGESVAEFDREKFKTLVIYIAWKAGRRDRFGATKLTKALWFSESRALVLHGKPIVGATYIRQEHGPVPKQYMTIRDKLARAGHIRVFKEGNLSRVTADAKPDMSQFSEAELHLIDHWIERVDQEPTAPSIREKPYDYGWEIAGIGEEIPLYAVLAERTREPSDQELERLKEVARAHGLL